MRAEARLEALPAAERATQGELLLADFLVEKPHVRDPSLVFEGLIGCEAIRTRLAEYQAVCAAAKRAERDPIDDLACFSSRARPAPARPRRMGMLFDARRAPFGHSSASPLPDASAHRACGQTSVARAGREARRASCISVRCGPCARPVCVLLLPLKRKHRKERTPRTWWRTPPADPPPPNPPCWRRSRGGDGGCLNAGLSA